MLYVHNVLFRMQGSYDLPFSLYNLTFKDRISVLSYSCYSCIFLLKKNKKDTYQD
jgi:hypothetical protein